MSPGTLDIKVLNGTKYSLFSVRGCGIYLYIYIPITRKEGVFFA